MLHEQATRLDAFDDLRAMHQATRRLLEALINATPTGPRRNALTEANIHLMSAEHKLREAEKLGE